MKKFKVITIVNITILLFVLIYLLISKQKNDEFSKYHIKTSIPKEKVIKKKRSILPKKQIKNKIAVDNNKSSTNLKLKKIMEDGVLELKKAQVICDDSFKNIAGNNDFIDVEIDFYKNPSDVIEKVNHVVANSLMRPEWPYIETIERLIDERSFDSKWAYQYFSNLAVCRSSSAMRFIETAFEAARHHHWSKKFQDILVVYTLTSINHHYKGYFLPDDITFLVGFLRTVIAQGLVKRSYLVELEVVMDNFINERERYKETVLGEQDDYNLQNNFKSYYYAIKDLGRELREIIISIIKSYSIPVKFIHTS